jgi:hypothetical protein
MGRYSDLLKEWTQKIDVTVHKRTVGVRHLFEKL